MPAAGVRFRVGLQGGVGPALWIFDLGLASGLYDLMCTCVETDDVPVELCRSE